MLLLPTTQRICCPKPAPTRLWAAPRPKALPQTKARRNSYPAFTTIRCPFRVVPCFLLHGCIPSVLASAVNSTLQPAFSSTSNHFTHVLSPVTRISASGLRCSPPAAFSRHGDENLLTATPLESALTKRDAPNSFRIRSYAKHRGGVPKLSIVQWSYRQTGLAPRLNSFVCRSYQKCRGVLTFLPIWNAPTCLVPRILNSLRRRPAALRLRALDKILSSRLQRRRPAQHVSGVQSRREKQELVQPSGKHRAIRFGDFSLLGLSAAGWKDAGGRHWTAVPSIAQSLLVGLVRGICGPGNHRTLGPSDGVWRAQARCAHRLALRCPFCRDCRDLLGLSGTLPGRLSPRGGGRTPTHRRLVASAKQPHGLSASRRKSAALQTTQLGSTLGRASRLL